MRRTTTSSAADAYAVARLALKRGSGEGEATYAIPSKAREITNSAACCRTRRARLDGRWGDMGGELTSVGETRNSKAPRYVYRATP
jgi:hypothetical protein